MSIELVASGSAHEDGFDLLKQAAESCVANGGDWYSPNQALGILQHHVGMPALLKDATFIGMCSPERVLRLFDMTAESYQQWVEQNWNRRGYDREPNELRELFIMSVGIGGEAGEVQELLKKHVRDGREIRDDLRLELGDVLHYLTRIAAQFGMTLGEIMLANREKIERRHAKREAARRAELAR